MFRAIRGDGVGSRAQDYGVRKTAPEGGFKSYILYILDASSGGVDDGVRIGTSRLARRSGDAVSYRRYVINSDGSRTWVVGFNRQRGGGRDRDLKPSNSSGLGSFIDGDGPAWISAADRLGSDSSDSASGGSKSVVRIRIS